MTLMSVLQVEKGKRALSRNVAVGHFDDVQTARMKCSLMKEQGGSMVTHWGLTRMPVV